MQRSPGLGPADRRTGGVVTVGNLDHAALSCSVPLRRVVLTEKVMRRQPPPPDRCGTY